MDYNFRSLYAIYAAILVCFIKFHASFGEASPTLGNDTRSADAEIDSDDIHDTSYTADSSTEHFIPAGTLSPGDIPFENDGEFPITDSSSLSLQPATATDTAAFAPKSTCSLSRETEPLQPAIPYTAISIEQDRFARQLLHYFHTFDWNNADKTGKKMQRLEKKRHLPPLSYLLMTGIRVMRIQNGAYNDTHEKKRLFRDIEKISSKGLALANPEKAPDSSLLINLLITGGIKGFVATLKIHDKPVNAALDGFAALKYLQKALDRDTGVYDAYLGIGLFHCILGKAPLILRSALSIIGKGVSFEKGIEYLRICARGGSYTNDIARLYLADFLSPYRGHEAREKHAIIRSLQDAYPENPYFVFLELEENLCFHPDMLFSFSLKERIRRNITEFKTPGDEARRYEMLVKWQYLFFDPLPMQGIMPDTTFLLGGFSYYPVFLRALREKLVYDREPFRNKIDRIRRKRYIKETGAGAARMLEASPAMPVGRKHFYLWHIRDALRIERETKR